MDQLKEFEIKGKKRESSKQARALLAEIKRLRGVLGVAHAVRNTPRVVVDAPKRMAGKQRPATLVAMASDWHVEERVNPRKVAGLNRYNPAIAEFRAGRFFAAILHMVETYNKGSWDVRNILLVFNGDLISGYIHEELVAGNAMAPIPASLFVESLLHAGLTFLAKHLPHVKVRIVCEVGNHGRNTAKVWTSMAVENSYEYAVYVHLAQLHPECEWSLPEGRHNFADIYGLRIHVHHGDTVKSQGGVGGILVPLNREAIRWREKYRAHLTLVGHFHQYMHTPKIVVNGSLIGYSSYADSLPGAAAEPPQQACFLVDAKRGVCQATPLWVGDPSAEKSL
jgi:hypothetical protein